MALIEARRLGFTYPGRPLLFQDLSIKLESGKLVWLTGETGGGKSTLVQLLAGIHPNRGKVTGEIVRNSSCQAGLLLQNVEWHLVTDRVEDEVAFSLESLAVPPEEIEHRISQVLARLGLTSLRSRSLRSLSAGEKQKVALASLLVMGRNPLILDEPLAYLDRNSARFLIDWLNELKLSGVGLMVVEHRATLATHCDTVCWLHNGQLTFSEPSKSPLHIRPVPLRTQTSVSWPQLRLQAGESLVLLGDNGSGKTTLLRSWASSTSPRPALVLQNPDRHLRLTTVEGELPDLGRWGLEFLAGRHPLSLSMGQKRLLTVASALSANPALLLLDEPSVGLDRVCLQRLLDWVYDFRVGGGTLVTATHDPEVAHALGDRCLLLDAGTQRAGGRELVEEYFCE